MSIWTSRKVVVGLVLGLSLTGCSAVGDGLSFLNLQEVADGNGARQDVSLPEAQLAGGAVSLTPPSGYCVDRRSVKQNFAVVARCDSLGGKGGTVEAPLAMILVSTAAAADGEADLPALQNKVLSGEERILQNVGVDDMSLLQLAGDTPEGTDNTHWRGLAQIGPNVVSLVAYAPPGGALTGPEGANVLRSLVAQTRANSVTTVPKTRDPKDAPTSGLGSFLRGLFD